MSGKSRVAIWTVAVAIAVAGYLLQYAGYVEPGASSLVNIVIFTYSTAH